VGIGKAAGSRQPGRTQHGWGPDRFATGEYPAQLKESLTHRIHGVAVLIIVLAVLIRPYLSLP